MNLLEESRVKIDSIDEQITKLFEQRMKAVEGVLEYKKQNNMQIFDGFREKSYYCKKCSTFRKCRFRKILRRFLSTYDGCF